VNQVEYDVCFCCSTRHDAMMGLLDCYGHVCMWHVVLMRKTMGSAETVTPRPEWTIVNLHNTGGPRLRRRPRAPDEPAPGGGESSCEEGVASSMRRTKDRVTMTKLAASGDTGCQPEPSYLGVAGYSSRFSVPAHMLLLFNQRVNYAIGYCCLIARVLFP
jgi:hypothetical protein